MRTAKEVESVKVFPLPEPEPHPLRANALKYRYARASMLSNLCVDYARQVQVMVENTLKRDDPYRGGNAEALLAITAARESLRAAKGIIKTSEMDEFFAQGIREEIGKFESVHPHVKQARDVIAHVDEYISSNGRNQDEWFDTTNRFNNESWVFRIGNKLDVNMPKLAADISKLADTVRKITMLSFEIESKMEAPSKLVEDLMAIGIYASVRVSGEVAEITINKVEPLHDPRNSS